MKAISLYGNACASHYDLNRGSGANQRSILAINDQGLSPAHMGAWRIPHWGNEESVMRDEVLPP